MDKTGKRGTVIKVLKWIGIMLTGLCGIILLGGDKITSGTLVLITAIIMALPIRDKKALRWVRVGFVCMVFGFVIWNISTIDLPGDGLMFVSPQLPGEERAFQSTGIRFLDQVIHIFNGFLEGRLFIREPR